MRPLTRSCFLLLVLGRLFLLGLLFLLGIFLRSRWSPPFPLLALALIPLFLAKVRLLPTLTLFPHDLVLWTNGSVPLPFGKDGSGVLANCSLCGTEATLSFRQAQYVPVFPLKPAPFCRLFAGLGSTNKSATFLFFSYYLTLVLSSLPRPLLHLFSYLKLCRRSGRNCLFSPPVLSGYNGSPDTRFSRGMTRLMSWPDGERYSRPPQSLVVTLLLSLVSTLVFSWTGGVLFHRSILTHRFPQFPLRKLCSLSSCSLCSLSSLLQRAPVPGHLSSHSALSSNGLFAPLTLWRLSVSVRPLVQTLGSCPASVAPWSSPIPRKGSGKQQQQQQFPSLLLPSSKKLFCQKSISFRGLKLWNGLDSELSGMHWVCFQKSHKLKLLNEY